MKQAFGFTLIELMIAVAIVGILAGVAYPSYQDSVRKSRRADVKAVLANLGNAMERRYTERSNYLGAAGSSATPADTGTPWILTVPAETARYYTVTISDVSANSYTLSAAPTGAQANDRCATLTLTHTGAKGNSANLPQSECW